MWHGRGRGTVQSDRDVVPAAEWPVPDGHADGRGPDGRDAEDAGVPAVLDQARFSDVHQYGTCVRELHGDGQRRPDADHAGRGLVRVHRLRRPRPVQAAPVSGHAVHRSPHVRQAQLRGADRVVDDRTVVHDVRLP